MPVDVRFGGGGCRGENRPGVESVVFAGFGRVDGDPWNRWERWSESRFWPAVWAGQSEQDMGVVGPKS
jgi:hypothetical protein